MFRCRATINIRQTHARFTSDNHLAAAAEPSPCSLLAAGNAQDEKEHHHHHNSLLRPQSSSSRRSSCPPTSAPCPSTERSHNRLTPNDGEQHHDESEEMSTLLSAVENLLHKLLVRSVCFTEQEAFDKCWAHSLLRAVLHCHSPGVATATTVARRLCIDVHDDDDDDDDNDNDNA